MFCSLPTFYLFSIYLYIHIRSILLFLIVIIFYVSVFSQYRDFKIFSTAKGALRMFHRGYTYQLLRRKPPNVFKYWQCQFYQRLSVRCHARAILKNSCVIITTTHCHSPNSVIPYDSDVKFIDPILLSQ